MKTHEPEFVKAEFLEMKPVGTEDSKAEPPASPTSSGNSFFDSFNPTTYRTYLQGLSDAALRKKEISKIQAEYRYQMSVTAGVMHGIATLGITAGTAVIAARNL